MKNFKYWLLLVLCQVVVQVLTFGTLGIPHLIKLLNNYIEKLKRKLLILKKK